MRGVPNGQRKKWTEETIAAELRRATGVLGSFPSASELRGIGMNDIVCAATKTGGLMAWADKLGLDRKDSDSDFGWRGEEMFCALATENGIEAVRTDRVKAPYDILLDGLVRVDTKTANNVRYGEHSGAWYFRIGKHPQADLVVLVQYDRRQFYALPWWTCPTTNISISESGGKYAAYLNNWQTIRNMIATRRLERGWSGPIASVA